MRACAWSAVLVALIAMAMPSQAQTAAEKAQAQALFDEARSLMKEGNVEQACDKFADSHKLDPAIGTQLNLAVCYEKLGRTASAWALFVEIRSTARRAGQTKRADLADRHAKALEPKLCRMLVEVAERVPGLTIVRGSEPIAEAAWGSPVPVDPGEHLIRAEAPGKKPWETRVTVGAEGDQVTVNVPPLEAAPPSAGSTTESGSAASSPAGPDAPESDGSTQRILGWTAGGVGVAAAGVGVVLRVLALGKDSESNDYCRPDDPMVCTAEGGELRDEAQSLELGSTIAWVGGGALVVTGIVLLLTAPSGSDSAESASGWTIHAGVGPRGGGATLGLSF
ncbi:MAG: hypothetical protein JRI23_14835 [Deltaproteobacteria bacterium]|nr:hypothetical protein [Deltaproteobacteria bacterium]MBW2533025.1 hypothetical protein [Deltaproteobacteria bacterium]